jgi:hypothetical protein
MYLCKLAITFTQQVGSNDNVCKLGMLPVPVYLFADSVSFHLVEVWYSIAVNIAEASINHITRLFRDFKKSPTIGSAY